MGETAQHGVFIGVAVDDSVTGDAELASKLQEVCPVDIFRAEADGVHVNQQNLDECVLCRLCINASPPGTVRVSKLYTDPVEILQ